MKKNSAVLLIVIAAAISVVIGCSRSAPADKLPTVAIFNLVSHPILNASVSGIKASLADAGFTPDKIHIIEVNANGEMDKLSGITRELLESKPEVIVPISTPVTQAVIKDSPPGQRVVYSTVTNPSDVGMDKQPKNVTGVSDVVNYEANFALIFELFPATKIIGVPYNAGERNSQFGVEQVKKLAEKRGVTLKFVAVANSQEVTDAVRSLAEEVDVIYVGSDNTVVSAIAGLTKVAYEKGKPVIASDSGSVDDGALAAVSVDYVQVGRKVGEIVADVLRTNKMPGDLPPVRFLGDSLLLNAKAASTLKYEFPASVKTRAKKIVE